MPTQIPQLGPWEYWGVGLPASTPGPDPSFPGNRNPAPCHTSSLGASSLDCLVSKILFWLSRPQNQHTQQFAVALGSLCPFPQHFSFHTTCMTWCSIEALPFGNFPLTAAVQDHPRCQRTRPRGGVSHLLMQLTCVWWICWALILAMPLPLCDSTLSFGGSHSTQG